MRAFFFALPLLLVTLPAPAQQPAAPQQAPAVSFVQPNQQEAKTLAETVYNTWRLSLQRHSEPSWRNSTTYSRQIKVRNMIISQRGNFPTDYFMNQPEPPALENFRYVGALANLRKDTIAATYVGRVQLGNGKPSESAFVLHLVRDNGKWKLDQTAMFNLAQLPKVRERLNKRDLSVLQEQDGFHPYAAAPAVPVACKAPELIGKVFVDAPGREIEMRINGISAHEFTDVRRADVISGGLRRGTNTITYHIKDEPGKPHPTMAIGLFVMPETPGNHPVCVFDHILDAQDAANGGSFTFNITNTHIASMNPRYTGEKPQPYHAVPLKEKPKK